nr:MAG: flagellar export chaperone FliS [Bacillota bacterium]
MFNPYEQYRTLSVATASPGRLILMLYDAALRNLRQAREALHAGHLQDAHRSLVRVQDILTELLSSLDFSAGEVAGTLQTTYLRLRRIAVDADVRKDPALVEELMTYLSELRDAWAQAAAAAEKGAQPDTAQASTGA